MLLRGNEVGNNEILRIQKEKQVPTLPTRVYDIFSGRLYDWTFILVSNFFLRRWSFWLPLNTVNSMNYNTIRVLFTWREEDPRRWIILAPYVFCDQFTCKGLYLLIPSRIFLRLSGRKILVQGTSSHHINCLRLEDPSTRDKPVKDGGGSFTPIISFGVTTSW